MIIQFNENKFYSVKCIAVKSETNIKGASSFMSGKLLIFAKRSLKSFIYSLVELLHFQQKKPQKQLPFTKKYDNEQIFCSQVLTDTDSTSIRFIFVSDLPVSYPESDVRDILFEIFSKTEIREGFHQSDEFWRCFNVQTATKPTV